MTFLYLNSDQMGQGEPELGKTLMKSFLQHLLLSDTSIDMIGCVNSAINLTTIDSPVIDILKAFEQQGVKIATCGTCLNYHNKQNDLLIGVIGNMEQTIQIMTKADKIIKPC